VAVEAGVAITTHLALPAAQVEQAVVEQGAEQHQTPALLALLIPVVEVVRQQSLKEVEETKRGATAAQASSSSECPTTSVQPSLVA
jgi:hypothetical protein